MPLLIRFILVALVAFSLGAATVSLGMLMLRVSLLILSPFGLLSLAILIISVAYAIQTIRRPPR
jgi:hypothetical protein